MSSHQQAARTDATANFRAEIQRVGLTLAIRAFSRALSTGDLAQGYATFERSCGRPIGESFALAQVAESLHDLLQLSESQEGSTLRRLAAAQAERVELCYQVEQAHRWIHDYGQPAAKAIPCERCCGMDSERCTDCLAERGHPGPAYDAEGNDRS